MTGAGLPPIALEAVRKILAIGQDSAANKKTVKPAEKPKFRLELTPEATSLLPPQRTTNTRNLNRAIQRRRPSMQTPAGSRPGAEGAESC